MYSVGLYAGDVPLAGLAGVAASSVKHTHSFEYFADVFSPLIFVLLCLAL